MKMLKQRQRQSPLKQQNPPRVTPPGNPKKCHQPQNRRRCQLKLPKKQKSLQLKRPPLLMLPSMHLQRIGLSRNLQRSPSPSLLQPQLTRSRKRTRLLRIPLQSQQLSRSKSHKQHQSRHQQSKK
jgi:hypothetical protein